MTCVFCRIVSGDLPSSPVHADDRALAFMDLRPATPGHLLVVPRQHATDLAELDPDDGAHLFRVAQRLAGAVRASSLRPQGVNLFLADGAAAGQEVFHVHLHVLPRAAGDGFRIDARFQSPSRAELDRHAADIRSALT